MINKILTSIFFTFLCGIIGFSQDEIKTLKKEEAKPPMCRDARFARVPDCENTVYYDEDQDAVFNKKSGKPFSGECKTCHFNGNIEMYLKFANGKSDGKDTVYYEDGKINLIRSHYLGKEDGTWMFFEPDGTLKWEKSFFDGAANGKHIYYFPDGAISKIEEWKFGKLNGVKKEFYKGSGGETGKLKKEINYKDGSFDGLYITYFENGMVESEQLFVKDKKDGLSRYYYDDGSLFYTENYKKGVKNGEIKRLYKNGNTWIVEKYKNDVKQGTWQEFYPDGNIKYEGVYKKGALVREHYYNENGDEMAAPVKN